MLQRVQVEIVVGQRMQFGTVQVSTKVVKRLGPLEGGKVEAS